MPSVGLFVDPEFIVTPVNRRTAPTNEFGIDPFPRRGAAAGLEMRLA